MSFDPRRDIRPRPPFMARPRYREPIRYREEFHPPGRYRPIRYERDFRRFERRHSPPPIYQRYNRERYRPPPMMRREPMLRPPVPQKEEEESGSDKDDDDEEAKKELEEKQRKEAADTLQDRLNDIDTKIAHLERRIKQKTELEQQKEHPELVNEQEKKGLPDLIIEDFRPKTITPRYDVLPEEQLIKDIMDSNHELAREFKKRSKDRDLELYKMGSKEIDLVVQDPWAFTKYTLIPDIRDALMKRILTNMAIQHYRNSLLAEQYKKLHNKWSNWSRKLDEKMSQKAAETIAISEESSNRRRGIRGDPARPDHDWEATMSMLGMISQEQEERIRERCVRDPPMVSYKPLKFIDNNHLVHDPVKSLEDFNRKMDLSWSEEEKDIFKKNLVVFDKSFDKIATFLPNKLTIDCVHYFYRQKKHLKFKQLIRKSTTGLRGRRRKEKVEPETVFPLFKTYVMEPDEEFVPRKSLWDGSKSDDEDLEISLSQKSMSISFEWTEEERAKAMRGFELFGSDFAGIASMIPTKSEDDIKALYLEFRKKAKPKKRGPKPKKKEPEVAEGIKEDENEKKRKSNDEIDKKKKRRKFEEGEIPERKTISYWSVMEKAEFLKLFPIHGKNWEAISKALGTKSAIQVRNYYQNSKDKLGLDLDKPSSDTTTVPIDVKQPIVSSENTNSESQPALPKFIIPSPSVFPPKPPPAELVLGYSFTGDNERSRRHSAESEVFRNQQMIHRQQKTSDPLDQRPFKEEISMDRARLLSVPELSIIRPATISPSINTQRSFSAGLLPSYTLPQQFSSVSPIPMRSHSSSPKLFGSVPIVSNHFGAITQTPTDMAESSTVNNQEEEQEPKKRNSLAHLLAPKSPN